MANIKSFPNNQDVYIGAEDVMKWLHGRTSGVFGADGNAAVAALTESAMAVTVADGNGWLANSTGDGIVWWNDHEKVNGSKLQIAIDAADGVLNRIDRIIVEWATTNYVDYPEIKVLKGAVSSTPSAPALTNNSTVRQISLAQISVAAGTTAITASMITDERLDSAVCGIVTESVKADTSVVNAQYKAAVAELKQAISEAWDGEISSGAVSTTYTATIPASGWITSNYGAYQVVNISGILATDNGIVDVNLSGSTSSAQVEIAEAFGVIFKIALQAGNICAFATEIPSVDIPIKIMVVRK